jgi:hypothetical protein
MEKPNETPSECRGMPSKNLMIGKSLINMPTVCHEIGYPG